MSINPHKNSDQSILFQNQIIPTFGCCYSNLQIAYDQTLNTTLQRRRFHSEPKESKIRKIDLTIGKRRHSLIKNEEDKLSTARKQPFQTASNEVKNISQQAKVTLTLASKLTTQKSSLKTSKVSFNQDLETCSFKNNQAVSWIKNTNLTNFPPSGLKKFQKQDFEALKLISEISLVEQEFVSHGSETLQVFGFITQLQNYQNQNQTAKLYQAKFGNLPQQKDLQPSMKRMRQAEMARKHFIL